MLGLAAGTASVRLVYGSCTLHRAALDQVWLYPYRVLIVPAGGVLLVAAAACLFYIAPRRAVRHGVAIHLLVGLYGAPARPNLPSWQRQSGPP